MKKLFPFSLSHAVDRCMSELTKFNSSLIASLPEAEPTPAHLNDAEFLKGNSECALYLHCSISTVKRLKSLGILSSFTECKFAWFRISDIIAAKEKNPELFVFRTLPAKAKRIFSPKLITKCHIVSDTLMFIYLTYQGWNCTVCTTPFIAVDQPAIFTLCETVIRAQHKFKPFTIDPE